MSEPTKPNDPNLPLPDPDIVHRTVTAAVERIREKRWTFIGGGALALIAIVAVFVVINLPSDASAAGFHRLWGYAETVRARFNRGQSAREQLAELEGYVDQIKGEPQEGLGLWLTGLYAYREAWTSDKTSFEERRPYLKKAIGYLEQLQDAQFDDLLLSKPRWFTTRGEAPVDEMLQQARSDLEWEKQHATPPVAPADDPVAVLRTSEGDIHLRFFKSLAPKHVNNFITLARKGTYNGTVFHFLNSGTDAPLGLMAGDPFSFFYPDGLKKEHVLRWGKGGVGYDLPPEASRYEVVHERGIVTSQRQARDPDWDNGVQFQVVLGLNRALDRVNTPFAKVVEGDSVLELIAKRKTASDHDTFKDDRDFRSVGTRDLFVEPVIIHKVIVFENGRALEHDFPLEEGEKALNTLSSTKAAALVPEAIACGRKLRKSDAEGDARMGLDIPFPEDAKSDASPDGERK